MVNHISHLNLISGQRVFLPLCGKTLDVAWLLSKGFRVVGAELSEIAIEQLFKDLNLEPKIIHCGKLLRYQAENIDMFVGDIFELDSELLGVVDAVYDRAALVALPNDIQNDMRSKYANHLVEITGTAKQLLISFEYDQDLMEGPPFSILKDEVSRLYSATYKLALLESAELQGGFRGKFDVTESIWLLSN